jgi:GNAT superfamily N-acetyltransferase
VTASLVISYGGGPLALQHFAGICDLYARVFSSPPFVWSDGDDEAQRQSLQEMSGDDTFGIALALNRDAVAGFAYGHRLPVSHGWWDGFPAELPPGFSAEWAGRTFALIDLAVDEAYRGHGVGGQLIGRLLGARAEERAVLSVQPAAVETHRIYEHLGWRLVGTKGPIPDVRPSHWLIYARDL